MKSLLLHTCCAPCASHAIERMQNDGFVVTLYFCNSNIAPEEEYIRRLESAQKLAELMDLVLIEDSYNHDKWLEHIKGYEQEPEKGLRCHKCFAYSLERTAQYARENNFDHFTSTLTISPHKIAQDIFRIGARFDTYLPIDFKKKSGFQHSLQLSREMNLYRQHYCGCEFSLVTPNQRADGTSVNP